MPFVNAGVRADGALGIATVLMLDRPLPTTTHAGTRNIAAAMIHERDDASASDAGAWQVVPGACGTGTFRPQSPWMGSRRSGNDLPRPRIRRQR